MRRGTNLVRPALPFIQRRTYCAIDPEKPINSIYVWGSCTNGQLGLGSNALKTPFPTKMRLKNPQRIIAGLNHTIAVNDEGVYSWGDPKKGRLGRGEHFSRPNEPREKIIFVSGKKLGAFACGGHHSIVNIEHEGMWRTYAFGLNNHGQLGVGDTNTRHTAHEVTALRGMRMLDISAGEYFTSVVNEQNEVFVFGRGSEGQIGRGEALDQIVPLKVAALNGVKINSVRCGWGHAIAIAENGDAFGWGSNLHGQCGIGSKSKAAVLAPIKNLQGRVRGAACGAAITVLRVKQSGDESKTGAWTAGSGGDGKLGTGETEDKLIPAEVPFFADQDVKMVAAGSDHLLALTDKSLFGWGFGQHGTLGQGPEKLNTFPTPVKIPFFDDHEVLDIKCGMDISMALVRFRNAEHARNTRNPQ